jgi:DNA-binding response OmpR family regulator
MKILVAEDDAVTRKILAVTLERLGWDVVTANDGEAAWEAFETLKGEGAPELAILDWMMPGIEGIEICRRLRATPGFELVYVILLTSRGDREDLSDGLAAGANDYIEKPFDPVELEARVRVGERMVNLQSSLAARVIRARSGTRRSESAAGSVAHLQLLQESAKRSELLGTSRFLPDIALKSGADSRHLSRLPRQNDDGARCSGRLSRKHWTKPLSLGAEAVLSKPLVPAELFEALTRAL